MISTSAVLFALLASGYVQATNDWSIPCVTGTCSWDTGDGKTTAYSSMAISGTNTLIGDITPAAGWNIQGCDPNWASGSHTFQIDCSAASNSTDLCSHLYEGGPENTVVRLPQNCGKGPFARVASISGPTGTSIAKRKAKAESKATISGPRTITLDYNFSKVPTSRGKVTFAITSSNVPPQKGVSTRDLLALRGRGRAGELHRRKIGQLEERNRVTDFVGNTASSISNGVSNAASAVGNAVSNAASAVGNAVSSANTVDKTFNSGKLTPINFDKNVNLFDRSISCNSGQVSGSANLKVDVEGKVQATTQFSATVVGTIVPPEVSDFSVTADIGGSANAIFTVDATVQGQFDTGKVELFKTGLPGLSIPSVVTIGPEFTIEGQVTVDLEAEAKLVVNAGWDFPNLHLVFPANKGGSTGSASVSGTDNPLQLSADPSIDVTGTVTGHLIPRIDFGVDFFSGEAQASIFIESDVSASLEMEVKATAKIDNKPAAAANSTAPDAAANSTAPDAANSNSTAPDASNSNSTSPDAQDPATSNSTLLDNGDSTNSTDPNTDDQDSFGDSNNSTLADSGDSFNSTDPDVDGSSFDGSDGTNSTDPTGAGDPTQGDGTDFTDTGDFNSTDPTTADDPNAQLDGSDPSTDGTTDPSTDGTTDPSTDDTTDPFGDGSDPSTDGTADSSIDGTADPSTDDTTDPLGDGSDPSTDDTTDPSTDGITDPTTDDFGDSSDDPNADQTTTDDTSDPAADDTTDPTADDTTDPAADDTTDPFADDTSGDSTDDTSGGTADDSTDTTADSTDGADDSTDDSTDNSDSTDDSSFFKRFRRRISRRATTTTLNGCVTLTGKIDVTGGLQGSLKPFIDDASTIPIFSKEAELFKKCLNGDSIDSTGDDSDSSGDGSDSAGDDSGNTDDGSDSNTKRSRITRREGDSSGLQCPAKLTNALSSIL